MAGRPQRKPTKPRQHRKRPALLKRGAPRAPLQEIPRPPAAEAALVPPQGSYERKGGRMIVVAPQETGPVLLSRAYAGVLRAELGPDDAEDAEKVMRALNRQAARENGGKLQVGQIVAHCLAAKAANLSGRDGVAAAKELADRTEGPVIQRVQEVSTRFVVSTGPSGTYQNDRSPLSIREWEAAARAADEADERAQVARLGLAVGPGAPRVL